MAFNTLLQTELSAFLDYEKRYRISFNFGNPGIASAHGHSIRSTGIYTCRFHVIGTANSTNRQTVALYKCSNDMLEAFVIHMFQKGVIMSEISDLIEKMYDHHYTPQTISNMTKAMSEQVEAFKFRPLDKHYTCVYLDATYTSFERETVSKKAVYITGGIREDGSEEVLQGLKGIPDCVPALSFQTPTIRHAACIWCGAFPHKVRFTDRKEICGDSNGKSTGRIRKKTGCREFPDNLSVH